MYLNSHQECQLEQARRDLEQCKRKLLDAQVQARGSPSLQGEGGAGVGSAAKGSKLRTTEKELKMASCSVTPVLHHTWSHGVSICLQVHALGR